jgi:hypothetical protein
MSTFSYKEFSPDSISVNQREVVTAPLWSNAQSSLTSVFTSSAQSSNEKRYYYEIFNSQSSAQGAESQFSLAYGHIYGSGSGTGSYGQNLLDYPTKAVYSQYKQLLLNASETLFKFSNDETSEYIYVININRARYKDRMDTSTWQLNLAKLTSGGTLDAPTAIVSLIDDSGASSTELASQGGRVYYIRSGSVANGINTSDTTPWGLFYPDYGVIILNGKAVDASASFFTKNNPATASGDDNAFRFFTSISGAIASNPSTLGFRGATSEVLHSTYYFARLQNNEFNYTTNNTFYSGSSNILKWPSMYDNPKTYVTTIGLYDDFYNLLAVAKLNKPIAKTFDKELVIKIKIDY